MIEVVEQMLTAEGVFQKVHLPGENLWVKVIEPPLMGTMVGKISNDPLMTPEHGFKCGDVVRFGWVVIERDGKTFGCWEPE